MVISEWWFVIRVFSNVKVKIKSHNNVVKCNYSLL